MRHQNRSKLIVLTGSGLCNRLKPILAGLRIADQSGRDFYMHWNDSQAISPIEDRNPYQPAHPTISKNVPFDGDWSDFFKYDIPRSNHAMCHGRDIQPDNASLPREGSGTYIARYVWRFLRFEDEPCMDYLISSQLSPIQQQIKEEILRFLPWLEPIAPLRQAIEDFATENQIDRTTVGIHVRRNQPHCGQFSLKAYISALDKALQSKRNVFLASDSQEVENLFKLRYRERLMCYPKRSRFRDDRMAVEDAIIDLSLLAKAGHLIGSSGSTFSDMAWWLGECCGTNEYIHRSTRPDSVLR